MTRRVGDLALLGVIGVTLAAAAELVPFLYPYPLRTPLNPLFAAAALVGDLLWVAAMLASYWRDAGGRMWRLLFASRLVAAFGTIWVANTSLTWTLWQLSIGFGAVVFAHLVLAFPSGRLGSRYDRLLIGAAYTTFIVSRAAWLVVWDPRSSTCFPRCQINPFVIWPNEMLAWLLGPGVSALVALLAVGVIVGIGRRWRRASPALRRALLPVAFVAPVELGLTAVRYVAAMSEATWETVGAAISTSPLAFVHALIPAGFLLGLLSARLARGALADLAMQVGAGIPLGRLRETLARALRDPTLALAFPAPGGAGFVDPDGRPIQLPTPDDPARGVAHLERDGEVLAALVYDPAIEAEDPGRVQAVASVARMALENERLAAQVRAQLDEVRASRARIVEAADAERRRIERDLHDGAQQRLVALAMRLDQARASATGAEELIESTTAELLEAVREVRSLAHGLHPTILTERGLAAAVEALAERSPLPIRARIPDERLPPEIEAASYFIIAEALTNAVRHAGAHAVGVEAVVRGRDVVLTVIDDGRGGADPSAGSGLQGLADRAGAVDGRLEVESPAGGGTTIRARLPLGE